MKVMFRNDYNGYFSYLKGKTLTVKEKIPCNEGDAKFWYILEEIEEIHLIKAFSLKVL